MNFTMDATAFPHDSNTTELGFYANFVNFINSSSWANLKTQNLQERAGEILMQPETILILLLCFLAFLANTVSICATCHNPNGLTTHSKLILSLACSDILITLTVFTHILNKVFNSPKLHPFFTPDERLSSSCMFAFVNAFNTSAHLISLLNLLAMAVDHYVAIMKPLHYCHLMNRARGNIMILSLWFIAFFGGASNFLSGIGFSSEARQYINYCEYIMYNDFHGEYLVIGTTFLCLVAVTYIYLRIYCEVRNLKFHIPYLQKDCLHNKKALITTLLIIGTFILCWLPTCLFQTALIIQIHIDAESVRQLFATLLRANKYLYALLLFNSLCDPIIYAVRLKYIQLGYYRFLAHCSKFYKTKLQVEGYKQRQFNRRGTTTKFVSIDVDNVEDNKYEENDTTAPISEIQMEMEITRNMMAEREHLFNNNCHTSHRQPDMTEECTEHEHLFNNTCNTSQRQPDKREECNSSI